MHAIKRIHLKRNLLLVFAVQFISIGLTAQSVTRLDDTRISFAELNKKIETLAKAAQVHGLAITIFNNNDPVYKKTFGYKRFDKKEELKSRTNIYGASLSKAVFAAFVMKLTEEGVLNLDTPLQQYLNKPIYEYPSTKKWHDDYSALKDDSLYQKITARMCLNHTTGFPNWRWDESDQKLRVKTTPGSVYSYSGEGMVYLQVVLEHMTGKSLEEMMQEKIFLPLKMKRSSYTWQPAFEDDYAWGHRSNGAIYEKDKDNDARSASTLETTLDDYTLFSQAILRGTLLKQESTNEMFRLQLRLRSVQQFGPLRFRDTSANDRIELGYGLGWGVFKSPFSRAAFKEGHGDGFQHYTILFPDRKSGIIIMSNSDNAESIFKSLLEVSIGDIYTPWYWQNYIPYDHKKQIFD